MNQMGGGKPLQSGLIEANTRRYDARLTKAQRADPAAEPEGQKGRPTIAQANGLGLRGWVSWSSKP